MPSSQTDITHYHVQLVLPNKGRAQILTTLNSRQATL